MNCLDARRTLATDPACEEAALLEHLASCEDCARAFTATRRFERALREAARIPVPENLASRILLRQTFVAPSRTRAWSRWPVALAASLVLAAGLFLGNQFTPPDATTGLGRDVVELVKSAGYALAATGPVRHGEVQDALRPVGLRLQAELLDVTFASRCYVRGKLAGHLVLKGEQSPITVFLIPNAQIENEAEIDSRDWSGKLLPASTGIIAVVAAPGEPLEAVVRMVQGAVRWKA